MQPSSLINITVATEVLATLSITALQLVTDRQQTLHGIITKKRHFGARPLLPTASDAAAQSNVGLRGEEQKWPSAATTAHVANDPSRHFKQMDFCTARDPSRKWCWRQFIGNHRQLATRLTGEEYGQERAVTTATLALAPPCSSTWAAMARLCPVLVDPKPFGRHFCSRDPVRYLLKGDVASIVGRPVIGLGVDAEWREPTVVGRA